MPVELPLPERAGYDFAGWYTEIESGTCIGGAGTYYTPEKSIVLHARWERRFDIAYMSAQAVETEDWIDTNEGNDYVTGNGEIMLGDAPEDWYLVRESIDSEDYITEKGVGWSFKKDLDAGGDGDYYPDGSSAFTEFFYEDALKANAVTTGGPKEEYRGQWPPSLTEQTAVVNLYRVWDRGPVISGNDLYYTLEEARNGIITEEELLSHAEAVDEEDGMILPGSREDNSFVILDYAPEDFTYFVSDGSVTETYAAVDSAKNCTLHRITVHIVDTQVKAAEEIHEKGVTRFINEFYYEKPARQGGVESTSVWMADAEYREELLRVFDRMRRGTPEKTVILN